MLRVPAGTERCGGSDPRGHRITTAASSGATIGGVGRGPCRGWRSCSSTNAREGHEDRIRSSTLRPTREIQPLIGTSLAAPAAVLTSAAAMPLVPGHQARSQPRATLAVTRVPSRRRRITPVTPGPVRPVTRVNAFEPSFGGSVFAPEEMIETRPGDGVLAGPVVNTPASAGSLGCRPEKQEKKARPVGVANRAIVKGPRASTTIVRHRPPSAGSLDLHACSATS